MKQFLAFIFLSGLLLAGCAEPPNNQPNPGNDPDPIDNPEPEDVCAAGVRGISFKDVLDIPYEDIDVPEEVWVGALEPNIDYGNQQDYHHAFYLADSETGKKIPFYGGAANDRQQAVIGEYVRKRVHVIGKFGANVDVEARDDFRYNLIIPRSIECLDN